MIRSKYIFNKHFYLNNIPIEIYSAWKSKKNETNSYKN